MKSGRKRFVVNRLFILGAGASYSATKRRSGNLKCVAPLDKDFCRVICELAYQRPGWVSGSVQWVTKHWCDRKPMIDHGLEEAISKQLGHIDFLNAVHPHRRIAPTDSYEYLRRLSYLIVFVLKKARENADAAYRTFSSKVFGGNPDTCEDRVITFNYDDVLDRHLLSTFPVQKVYFDRMGSGPTSRYRRNVIFDAPLIVKLHGSVNWRCGKDEFSRSIGESTPTGDPYISVWCDRTGAPAPGGNTYPLIIPPLAAKPLSQIGIFRYLWQKAYEYLFEAREIIVCGYSLPEFDQFAKSLFANFTNKRMAKITVVDPDPQILKKWQQLLKRGNVPDVEWAWADDFTKFVSKM
jgi:hypothetical protein